MKFALFIATLALVSGINKNKKDDINYDAHFDAGQATAKSSYTNDKAHRDSEVGAQAASDAWRGVKDGEVFALRAQK